MSHEEDEEAVESLDEQETASPEPVDTSFGSSSFSLSPQIVSNIERQGLKVPTPVQLQIIPKIRNDRGKDLCVNAPTGSGKTLAYVLPIVQNLSKRLYTALGCVVIVPTRELVQQVRETFDICVRKTGLKVESAQGQRNFAEEQEKLVNTEPIKLGGNMLIDILVTTPGRLVEHILHTPGFTLQHLQFLVLDEADRLLHQSFQNWTELVMREISNPKALQTLPNISDLLHSTDELPIIGQRHVDRLFGDKSTARPVRKLIFSATLTHDLGKLASLQIRDPEIISVVAESQQSNQNPTEEIGNDPIFSLPTTLHEYAIAATDDKPLLLLHLLNKYRLQENTLIFTNSTETATRLNHLLTQFYKSIHSDISTAVISSEVPLKTRKKLLSSLTSGKLNIVITTDLLSRGMDIKGVQHIVSYDSPPTARVYVHRAGRTARAGRDGDVWTLVADKEARWFWKNVVAGIQRSSKVERVKITEEDISKEMRDVYHSIVEV